MALRCWTHLETDLSTLAVRYGAFVEYLRKYHDDILNQKTLKNVSWKKPWKDGRLVT